MNTGEMQKAAPAVWGHRVAILLVYIFSNIYAAWLFIDAGATTNEFRGLPVVPGDVLVAAAIAISALCMVTMVAQPLITKIMNRCIGTRTPRRHENAVGIVVFGLLGSQLAFSVLTGSQFAAQLTYIDSGWAAFFLLFNGDYVFLAYYCFYRESKWCVPNMALYLASGLIRGWGGGFLIIGFLEVGRQLRLRKFKRLALIVAVILVASPGIDLFRTYVRALAIGAGSVEISRLVDARTFESVSESSGGLAAVAGATAETILMRFQHTEVDITTNTFREYLASLYERGAIRPFYAEGVVGKGFMQILGVPVGPDLHFFLPRYFHGWSTYSDIGYNVHLGIGSWLAILDTSFPIVVLYSCFLIALTAFLISWNAGTEEGHDVAWLAALLFICSGWFGPYEAFLQALFLLIAVEAFLRCLELASLSARQSLVASPSNT